VVLEIDFLFRQLKIFRFDDDDLTGRLLSLCPGLNVALYIYFPLQYGVYSHVCSGAYVNRNNAVDTEHVSRRKII